LDIPLSCLIAKDGTAWLVMANIPLYDRGMSPEVTQCPKCGQVRRPGVDAPDWQCPACGIAYHKYKVYAEKVWQLTRPRTSESGPAPVEADGSIWMLVMTNLFVLAVALASGWRLIDMMLVFWIQSVVIGVSYLARIASLKQFSTENFRINDLPVDPTPETRRSTAIFFAFHYGFFHFKSRKLRKQTHALH